MELNGKIFKVLPLQTGESQRGKWQKQDIVIEVDNGKFPKKVAVTMWGDLISNNSFAEGANISVEFDVESREYNGKWYTDVKAWRINKLEGAGGSSNNNYQSTQSTPPAYTEADIPAAIDDDLPF